MNKGKLIVIEGGDSSGKATQTALLKQALKKEGIAVEELDFPRYDDNQVGALIKECLKGQHEDFIKSDPRLAAVLYAADRKESLKQISEWCEQGKVVLLDRYTSASLVHQGGKCDDAEKRKEIMRWIYKLEHDIFGIPKPDLLFYLHVPAETRLALLQKQQKENGRELDLAESNQVHQEQVDRAASDMLDMYEDAIVVQCMKEDFLLPKEDIAAIIETHVTKLLAT